jgi:hypothetical protein
VVVHGEILVRVLFQFAPNRACFFRLDSSNETEVSLSHGSYRLEVTEAT